MDTANITIWADFWPPGELYPAHLLHIFPYIHYPFYRISLCARWLSIMYRCVHFAITLRMGFFQYFYRASFSLTLSVDLMIMTTFSIFLIISVAIERYLAVCRPHHYREIQTDSSRSWWWSVHMRFFYWTFFFN